MLALIFATPKEAKACLGATYAETPRGAWSEITLHHRPCLQVVTGVGPINAAFTLGKLLGSVPQISGVINLGIGGSFDLRDIPLGEWVVANGEIWPEIGLRHLECVHAKALGFPLGEVDGETIWDRLNIDPEENARSMGVILPPSLEQASFITVAGVTSTLERALFLQTVYRCGVENMEGFPLALACATHGIPFLEIRAISNEVGPKEPSTWRLDLAFERLGNIPAALFTTP